MDSGKKLLVWRQFSWRAVFKVAVIRGVVVRKGCLQGSCLRGNHTRANFAEGNCLRGGRCPKVGSCRGNDCPITTMNMVTIGEGGSS
jgi:hypothetical protein